MKRSPHFDPRDNIAWIDCSNPRPFRLFPEPVAANDYIVHAGRPHTESKPQAAVGENAQGSPAEDTA